MKWPKTLSLLRHAQSAYNDLKLRKELDPEYRQFKKAYNLDPLGTNTQTLASAMEHKYALGVSDYDTPLSDLGVGQARLTGEKLYGLIGVPDVIIVSPYKRTRDTLEHVFEGGFPRGPRVVVEDRIREQEHGLSLLYNDWRIFHIKHPEQKALRDLLGPYWYQYPQGESVSHVRDRIRSFTNTIIREYAGMNVLLVTHHLTILSIRANFERLSPEEFIRLDEHEKPINCGVTVYRGDPSAGANGKLLLESYNNRIYR
jgi:broad specificity phosphatase PhoE